MIENKVPEKLKLVWFLLIAFFCYNLSSFFVITIVEFSGWYNGYFMMIVSLVYFSILLFKFTDYFQNLRKGELTLEKENERKK